MKLKSPFPRQPHRVHSSGCLFAVGIILFSAGTLTAKMQTLPGAQSARTYQAIGVREFESRMRPFFDSKLKGFKDRFRLPRSQLPCETDFLQLALLWNRLSPEFKTLYKKATQIPDSFAMYISPGGHFEVYYTTSDTSLRVDSTDTIRYGAGSDWRPRLPVPNGVPDYVDEVAWALDSSWSMEVDRFNFIRPLPNKDSIHTSDRYRAVITWFNPGWYALTYPDGKADSAAVKGYTSHIEIRNTWSGSEWNALGYTMHPENAVRVTCAHELFHGVQYAMTWNLPYDDQLDNFPLAWIEGTAVLMEELAFDYVNEYLQYAGFFFNDPQMSFFDASIDVRVYTNALLTKYLFEKATGSPRIDFIRNIFFVNYAQVTPFHPNLRATSLSFGSPWTDILNHFHTGSYYTGARADTARFLADAGLMGAWSVPRDTLSSTFTVVKPVNSYGMQLFSFAPDSGHHDTLFIGLAGERNLDTLPYPLWGASCIIKRPMQSDSLLSLSIDTAGRAACSIAGWKTRSGCMIITSNGHPSERKNMTVSLLPCPVMYRAGEKKTLRTAAADNHCAITAEVTAKRDLRCALTACIVSSFSRALPPSKLALSPFFEVSYPAVWGGDAAISLTFSLRSSFLDSVKKSKVILNDSTRVFRWNALAGAWEQMPSRAASIADTISWRADSALQGIYVICASEFSAQDSSGKIAIYPNPAHIRARKLMLFEGSGIQEIRIYSVDGTLVSNSLDAQAGVFNKYNGGIQWQLVNSHGKNVVPGYYTAVITRIDPLTDKKNSTLHKVLVFP